VSVSLTIDDTSKLKEITEELSKISAVTVEKNRAMVCIVGDGLKSTPGIAAKVFGAVCDINVILISQGASKLNLTFVIDEAQVGEAVNRLHEALFFDESVTTDQKQVLATEAKFCM
jgi:aspartate kinase